MLTVPDLPLWQKWLLVSAVGGPLLTWIIAKVGLGEYSFVVALAATWVGQSFLLRGHITKAYAWLLWSLAAGLLGMFFGVISGGLVQDAIDGVVSSPAGLADVGPGRTYLGLYAGRAAGGAILGTTLGFAQWLILRREFQGATWWLPATIVGFAADLTSDAPLVLPGIATGLTMKLLRKWSGQAVKRNSLAVVTAGLDVAAVLLWAGAFLIVAAFPPAAGHHSPLFSPASGPFMLVSTLGWLVPLIGLVTGVIALRQIAKTTGREKGKALAWTGIIVGAAFVFVFLILLALSAVLILISKPS